jgi:hypothetical protein
VPQDLHGDARVYVKLDQQRRASSSRGVHGHYRHASLPCFISIERTDASGVRIGLLLGGGGGGGEHLAVGRRPVSAARWEGLRELDKRVVITFKEPKMGPRGPPGLRAARPAAYRPGPRGAAVRLQYQRARRSSNCRAGRDGIEPRAGETYRPRGRYSPVIRRSPYEVTRPCRPGGSLSRCCGPGATTPYRWRSTGPAVTARASTLKVE